MRPVIRNSLNLTSLDFMVRDGARWLHDWTVIVAAILNFESPHSIRTTRNDHERTVHEPSRPLTLASILGQTIARTVSATTITAEPDFSNATRFLLIGNGGCLDYNIVTMLFGMSLDSRNEGISVRVRNLRRRNQIVGQVRIVLHVVVCVPG